MAVLFTFAWVRFDCINAEVLQHAALSNSLMLSKVNDCVMALQQHMSSAQSSTWQATLMLHNAAHVKNAQRCL